MAAAGDDEALDFDLEALLANADGDLGASSSSSASASSRADVGAGAGAGGLSVAEALLSMLAAWRNEKAAPIIMPYARDAVERLDAAVRASGAALRRRRARLEPAAAEVAAA